MTIYKQLEIQIISKKIVFAESVPFITSRPPWILIFYTYFVALTSLILNSTIKLSSKGAEIF
jgi:hypothetical protein